jgi:hypothetical protein
MDCSGYLSRCGRLEIYGDWIFPSLGMEVRMTTPTLDTILKEYETTASKSTPVVAWYPMTYESQVRGPYNRWFQLLAPREPEIQNGRIVRAADEDDIRYAAMAMTEFPRLIAAIKEVQAFMRVESKLGSKGTQENVSILEMTIASILRGTP